MTSDRAILAAIGMAALTGVAQAQTMPPLVTFGAAESGVETVVAVGRHWNTKPCVPQGTAIAITQPPEHGTVRIVNQRTDVPKSTLRTGSTGYCAGMLLFAKNILYRSEPRFAGTDTLSYESVGPNGQRLPYTVTITVTSPD